MFLFNWFRSVSNTDAGVKGTNTPVSNNKSDNPPEVCVIKKDDYDALINRLRNLEAMMNALPIKPVLPTNFELRSTPKPELVDSPKEHPMTPFQLELEQKLKSIRTKMGASHGFGINGFALENLDDLKKLEQSIMEQSMLYEIAPTIQRSRTPVDNCYSTPVNISLGNTPSPAPMCMQTDYEQAKIMNRH